MVLERQKKSWLATYSKDTAGGIAMTWALSMTVVIFAVGAAFDMSQLSKAKQQAQMVADNMALAASISVDRKNDAQFAENKWYPYNELGTPGTDFTDSMRGFIVYDIVDDKDTANTGADETDRTRLLARATITGTYSPAFLAAFGYSGLDFKAVSDVAYAEKEGTPASIFFVTDNSGSMSVRDDDDNVKLASLKTTLKTFMGDISELETDTRRLFRTALFPYAGKNPDSSNQNWDGLITGRVINPQWGTLASRGIDRMRARDFTDSSGALGKAREKFPFEANLHLLENGEEDPLKFLVFMTDGVNNPVREQICKTERQWVKPRREYWVYTENCGNTPRAGSKVYQRPRGNMRNWRYTKGRDGYWRNRRVCDDNGCQNERQWVNGRSEYWTYRPQGNSCGTTTYKRPKKQNRWRHYPGRDGYWRDREVCDREDKASYGRDERSLKHCAAMKNAGVKIYAIAYDVTEEDQEHAEEFMRACSSGNDYFKTARDASALEQAFTEIGESIAVEVIRIKR